jgi:outer membrane protein, heavy metal efflux system
MIRRFMIVTAVVAVGCARVTPTSRHEPETVGAARSVSAASPDVSPPVLEVSESTTALTLRDAVALALLRSPDLAEYAWQIRAAEARVLQASLRPNPEVSLLVEDVVGTGRFEGVREAQATLELAQIIELGGKRAARIDAASATERLATQEYELKRVEVLADVTRRFIRVLAAQEIVGLTAASMRLSQQTIDAVARRVEAGASSPLEDRKARIELARSTIVGEHAQHELAVARRELAATWASSEPQFERVEGNLLHRTRVPTYASFSERLSSAPEVIRQISERTVRETEIRLAETRRVPNLTILGGVRRLQGPGDESFLFGVRVPLPTSDRNQGGVAEARALLAKSEATSRATETRVATLLFAVHQELLHAALALDTLDEAILPQSEESLALARRGFAEGRFSYLELMDAQRTLVAVQKERIDTAEQYQRLVLELERLLGGPMNPGEQKTRGE